MTELDLKNQSPNDAKPLLAAAIIQAVIKHDWAYMLTLFPEGVEHKGINNTVEHFADWDTYDDFARYVSPARTMLIDKCLNKVLECLSNGCS